MRLRPIIPATALLLVTAVTGCDLYVDPTDPVPGSAMATYQLVPRGNIAAPGPIAAVAWDGSQHWIVSREENGDYWEPDRIEVFRYDVVTGTASEPIVLTDHWERPTGAAWLQGKLWLHYDANNTGLVTALDPATGEETVQFSVGWGMRDIDTDGTSLYLADSSVMSFIQLRDPATGAITDERWTLGFQGSLRGVGVVTPPGATEPEVWGGTMASNELAIMVGQEQVARAVVGDLPSPSNFDALLQFTGQDLTLVAFNQLHFYRVVRPAGP